MFLQFNVFLFVFLQGTDAGTMRSVTFEGHLSVSKTSDDYLSRNDVLCVKNTEVLVFFLRSVKIITKHKSIAFKTKL